MSTITKEQAKQQAVELLKKSGFPVTEDEWQRLDVNDFGLDNLPQEGFAFIDILRSPRVRITILILLPDQSLPQHLHPSYDQETGKEETLRVLWGRTSVFIPGAPDDPAAIRIPDGKDNFYTARQAIVLDPGGQYSVQPTTAHWFQAGPQGSVNIAFQNRVDETKNLFYDPKSSGCPIKATDA